MNILGKLLSGSLILIYAASVTACGSSKKSDTSISKEESAPSVQVPIFNADSAYQLCQGSGRFLGLVFQTQKLMRNAENILLPMLERFGAKVYNQNVDLVAYDGTLLKARNIIGAYNPEAKKRVLLFAHWDSRSICAQ